MISEGRMMILEEGGRMGQDAGGDDLETGGGAAQD